MKFGFVLPYGDARAAAEMAALAEASGWDGFFVWEPVWGIDAWVLLTAAAMRTSRIRLGTMLSPLSRMRPWKLASEAATLDNLSNGRVILSVGLGAPETGFAEFGEPTDRKTRSELLDEGLEILTGLWAGQPFSFSGEHYQVKETSFYPPPPPVQKPHIPIWVVGAWPSQKSMQRVLKYDGLLPQVLNKPGDPVLPTPDELRLVRAYIQEHRTLATSFDIVVEGETPAEDPARASAIVKEWQDAGATWWIEARWSMLDTLSYGGGFDQLLDRIRRGPPPLEG